MKNYAIIIIFLACAKAYAWENTITHKDISDAAAKLSLRDSLTGTGYELNGKNLTLSEWIQEGSELEDAGYMSSPGTARYRNHFHNPLCNAGTPTECGLTDMMTGQSALLWAQDGENQSRFVGGDWSWRTVRAHYYHFLTATSKAEIDRFTAMTYLGLGYQVHLVQDISQPDHVRNDAHPIDGSDFLWGFETWTRRQRPLIKQYAATATKPTVDLTQPYHDGLAPVGGLMDTGRYTADRAPSAAMNQGLVEYTNANFFSDDTIFAGRFAQDDIHYFPFPRREGTNVQKYFDGSLLPEKVLSEDGKSVEGLWISKSGEGETVPHLVRVGTLADMAFTVFGEGDFFYDTLFRDEITYDDYARLLIPRAVGYSAALLDYFFRGKIKFTLAAPEDITFRGIKVTAQNDTAGETMGSGDISLVIRYKAQTETDLGGGKFLLNNPSADYSYKVTTLKNQDLSTPRELTFDFSADPLPADFDDMTMQLVYRGKLGNEDEAVSISKPEPIDAVYTDFDLSLPASGVYAQTSDNTLNATFDELRVTALTTLPGGLTGGRIILALEYNLATSDPFQSQPVNNDPSNATAYIMKAPEKNGVDTLAQNIPVELVFDLTSSPLPVNATNVYLRVHYLDTATAMPMAKGFRDISEPTPIDVFNNADKRCIHGQWYTAGSPEAIAQVDANHNQIAEEEDVYPHNIANIFYKASAASSSPLTSLASASNYTFSSPAVLSGGAARRLGFILTDYNFKLSGAEQWLNADPHDPWVSLGGDVRVFDGIAVENQEAYSLMTHFRNNLLWNGGRFIFVNTLDENAQCGWDKLNQ